MIVGTASKRKGLIVNRRQFLKRTAAVGAAAGFLPEALTWQVNAAEEEGLKAGFAERDITPELGMEKPGGYGKAYLREFHDPCKVRAAVFDDGNMRVALVGLDALMVPRHLVKAVRKDIQNRCGISPEAILIGASHSHSSGPLGMVQPGQYDHASPLVQELAYQKSSAADPDYLKHVHQQIVEAVCRADASKVEALCGVGSGTEDKVGFNRRLRMKNGLTYSHPGKGNPDIIGYAGPIDPEVGVIGAWDQDGRLLGCIVNYACHATTNPDGISANWIYYMEKVIRGAMGADLPVVFLQGACGDITQVDNLSPYANPSGEEWAEFVGGRVGAEAVKVLLTVEPGSLTPLDARSKILGIKRRVPSPDRVKQCFEIVKQAPEEAGSTRWIFAKEIVLLDALLEKEPIAEVEVQAIQIGPAVFITNPAEFFVQLGLDIKAGSPFPFTYPVELANGCVGYVPTEEALSETGGGYETRLTSYSNLEPTAGTQMVKAGIELARQMKPGKAPTPPQAPPFKEPWSYGNVPPELD
ncbi:MAG: twin-arginine translocation signal domain-containing protein [Acidobacteriota bacterium]